LWTIEFFPPLHHLRHQTDMKLFSTFSEWPILIYTGHVQHFVHRSKGNKINILVHVMLLKVWPITSTATFLHKKPLQDLKFPYTYHLMIKSNMYSYSYTSFRLNVFLIFSCLKAIKCLKRLYQIPVIGHSVYNFCSEFYSF
jgi:hypothetical protein